MAPRRQPARVPSVGRDDSPPSDEASVQGPLPAVAPAVALPAEPPMLPVPDADDARRLSALHEFQRQRPPRFRGETDPQAAEDWLEAVVRVFRLVRTPADLMVILAASLLHAAAGRWWSLMRSEERRVGKEG